MVAKVQKLCTWVKSWDAASRTAAAMCAVPFAIVMFGGGQGRGPSTDGPSILVWETALSLMLAIPAVMVLLPIVAATPWVTFLLVRRTEVRSLQAVLLAIAAATLVLHYRFVRTADLTSTSTASLGAAFYPVYLAFFAVPLSLALFWFVRRKARRAR